MPLDVKYRLHAILCKHRIIYFIIAGGLAFLVDAMVLLALIKWVGLSPLIARLFAIATAMVVAWIINRYLTFALDTKPTWPEFLRYAAMAATSAIINYSIFGFSLFIYKEMEPFAALVISTGITSVFSYVSMRFIVFR